MYYKDVKNDPLSRHFIDYWQEFEVACYYPDAYSDIRGVEVRLEKTLGRFLRSGQTMNTCFRAGDSMV